MSDPLARYARVPNSPPLEGETAPAKREPDRAKHQEKAPRGSIAHTVLYSRPTLHRYTFTFGAAATKMALPFLALDLLK